MSNQPCTPVKSAHHRHFQQPSWAQAPASPDEPRANRSPTPQQPCSLPARRKAAALTSPLERRDQRLASPAKRPRSGSVAASGKLDGAAGPPHEAAPPTPPPTPPQQIFGPALLRKSHSNQSLSTLRRSASGQALDVLQAAGRDSPAGRAAGRTGSPGRLGIAARHAPPPPEAATTAPEPPQQQQQHFHCQAGHAPIRASTPADHLTLGRSPLESLATLPQRIARRAAAGRPSLNRPAAPPPQAPTPTAAHPSLGAAASAAGLARARLVHLRQPVAWTPASSTLLDCPPAGASSASSIALGPAFTRIPAVLLGWGGLHSSFPAAARRLATATPPAHGQLVEQSPIGANDDDITPAGPMPPPGAQCDMLPAGSVDPMLSPRWWGANVFQPGQEDRPLKLLVSGGLAGAVSRTATAPMDRLKLLLQVEEGTVSMSLRQVEVNAAMTLRQGVQLMLAENTMKAFFRGNGCNVLKNVPENAFKLTANELVKAHLLADGHHITVGERVLVGGLSGGLAQALIYPLEVVQTRLAVCRPGLYAGIWDCVASIYRHEGLHGLFRGLSPTMLGILPYAGLDIAGYELARDALMERRGGQPLPPHELLLVGMGSSIFAQLATYPLCLVRTRLQVQGMGGVPGRYRGMWDVFHRTLAEEGGRGLYRGLLPNMLKIAPAAGISWFVFEETKLFLHVNEPIHRH